MHEILRVPEEELRSIVAELELAHVAAQESTREAITLSQFIR